MSARMAEDVIEAKPEQLFPHADGTFEPIFNDAVNRTSDRDEFLLDVRAFSTLTVDLLSGRLALGRLMPDEFEPNDSFEAATRLQVVRPSGPFWVGPLFSVHGP